MQDVYAELAKADWQRLSAGRGNKDERWYDWQCRVLAEAAAADKGHYLLFRRAPSRRPDRPISRGAPGLRHAHSGLGRRQSLAHRVGL